MSWIEALILGIIQGLTEFLPVSSSGHLELAKEIMNVQVKDSLIFTVVVHGATVLSTIVVFRKDILNMIVNLLKFEKNDDTVYVFKLLISMLPVLFVGIFFKDEVESLFSGNVLLVGFMLILTAVLLGFTYFYKPKEKKLTFSSAFIIGISQAIAVIPGISRSGSTIATGLLLGVSKEKIAKFSFLMVLLPIIGANILSIYKADFSVETGIPASALFIGFVTAFISGVLACSLMINIVKKGKLIYFAIYCLIIGMIAVGYSLFF